LDEGERARTFKATGAGGRKIELGALDVELQGREKKQAKVKKMIWEHSKRRWA